MGLMLSVMALDFSIGYGFQPLLFKHKSLSFGMEKATVLLNQMY